MKKVLILYKPKGLTPLESIKRFQEKNTEYQTQKLSYAGRLDPMAEGLLLVLVGNENKKQTTYKALPKSYEFSVLLNIATDTNDLLGKVIDYSPHEKRVTIDDTFLQSLSGKQKQAYPAFSSFHIKRKPLFWWARKNRLAEITIPEKEIEIFSLTYKGETRITTKQLHASIQERIQQVSGDFRQKEILLTWKRCLEKLPNHSFSLLHFTLSCSSGTYVRVLTEKIGKKLDIPATTYTLKRTSIGKWTMRDAIKLS